VRPCSDPRLQALKDARTRAQQQRWDIAPRVTEAEAELNKAKQDDPTRRVYDYVNNNETVLTSATLVSAQARLDEVEVGYQNICQPEDALDAEISQVSNRVNQRQTAVHMAMAEFVTVSPVHQSLIASPS